MVTKYEIELALYKPSSVGKVYALDINVEQSPLEKGKDFYTEEFVNSEDFQHLLDSIKIEVNETTDNQNNV